MRMHRMFVRAPFLEGDFGLIGLWLFFIIHVFNMKRYQQSHMNYRTMLGGH